MDFISGIFENSIDSKYRIVIPQALREFVGEEVYLTHSDKSCIRVYSCAEYERLYLAIAERRKEGADTRALQDLFIRPARRVALDQNGRISLSADMRRHAKIGDEDRDTLVIGDIDHLEIWSSSEFYGREPDYSPEEMNESLKSVGAL